jgi:tetratricopeptide (TPR) repeat protein
MRIGWIHALVLAVTLGMAGPAHAANTWALLVGVSKYETPQIASLKYPSADAEAIKDALVDPKIGGLAPNQVKLLADSEATRDNILGSVESFLKPNVKAGDQVIVFIAGHGVAKGVGAQAKSFLLPTDVKGLTTQALESSAVDLRELSAKLGELPASQYVLFVDACREDPTPGRAVKGNVMSDVLSRGVHVIPADTTRAVLSATFFACSVGERAFEDPNLKHGVFTYYILDGIRNAAIPQKPDGAVELGSLASYVQSSVKTWAEKTTKSGIYEVEQTPQCIRSESDGPLILVRVKRDYPDTPLTPTLARVVVGTFPEGAAVSINGAKAGAGPVETVQKAGEYKVRVEAPGYKPVERSVSVLDGYENQVLVRLEPEAPGAVPAGKSAELYQRALDAETRQQWEVAVGGYKTVIGADPKFAPAYERLADLYTRQGRPAEAIGVLIDMVGQTPASAHGYGLLSRAYSSFAERQMNETAAAKKEDDGGGKKKGGGFLDKFKKNKDRDKDKDDDKDKNDKSKADGPYIVPDKAEDALDFARKAAGEALKLDKSSPDAHLAVGFALAAEKRDKDKRAAMDAFGQAVFLDPKDPTTHYGLGYGIRSFAQGLQGNSRESELKRAIAALNEAVALRPGYYEAHRELAYCYHLLDDRPNALREYELANANRGAATDEDEVAGMSVAMSSIHKKEADRSSGMEKQQQQAASDGYYASAQEQRPNLKKALYLLDGVGLRSALMPGLPTSAQDLLGQVRSRIPRPSIPGLPGLPF